MAFIDAQVSGASVFSELHGNSNLERCVKCGQEYLRDFYSTGSGAFQHVTGRRCTKAHCLGDLKDSVIAFGESLPMREIDNAQEHGNR